MAYEKKRIKILNILKQVFWDTNYFSSISLGLPDVKNFPNVTLLPSLHIARTEESIAYGTNFQAESDMGIMLIGVCQSSSDLDIVKTELQEEIEEVAFNLLTNNDFVSLATIIQINSVDFSPLSLAPLGYVIPILPPFGIVKINGFINFLYNIK